MQFSYNILVLHINWKKKTNCITVLRSRCSRSCVPYLVTMYFYFVCFGWMYRGSKFSELLARSHQIIQYIVLTVGNYSRHPPSIAQYQFSWTLYKFVSTKKRKWNKVLSPLTLPYLAKEKGVLRCYHKYLFAFFSLGAVDKETFIYLFKVHLQWAKANAKFFFDLWY